MNTNIGSVSAGPANSAAVPSTKASWSTRMAFILAASGSAVGLGNIWKFPYITGENGGGAFVLVYLICVLAIGVPLLMAEVMLGRRGKNSPPVAMKNVAKEMGASQRWSVIGWMGVITGILLLSFYIVVSGWALSYIFTTGSGAFNGASPDQIGGMFGGMLADPARLIAWSTVVLAITMYIISRGVNNGLEWAVNKLMPGLLLLILVLVGYAMTTGHFSEGLNYLFNPDFSKITSNSVLVALGHAFFTLSLAGGGMMTYGAYLPKKVSLTKACLSIAAIDTIVALLAGMAIFPIVFAYGLDPSSGPGLIFVTLPIAFGQMPLGILVGVLFFVMLSIAALTSAISLLEPAVSWLTGRFNMTRAKACLGSGAVLWILSLGTVFSFNIWEEKKFFGKTFFEMLDFLTASWIMPLTGLLIALFAGWVMTAKASKEEFGTGISHRLWYIAIRFVSPVAIIAIFLHALKLI
ncbi:sodium-dependent transporter [Amphritea sp.]|uniref:sodium-dependent transporter n=1 Tax=Amphritea sp. TaxID=1872502 RepID=UPI003D11A209